MTGYETLQGSASSTERDLYATVEIAHEHLFDRWPTLRRWVELNRGRLRDRRNLRAKAEWNEKGQDVWVFARLGYSARRGRSLLDSPGDVPVDDLRDYVDQSIKKEEQRFDAERKAALPAEERRIARGRT